MDDVIGIYPQSLDTIDEETLKGLRPIKGLLILFSVVNQGECGHTTCQILCGMVDALGNEDMVDDIRHHRCE